MQLKEKKEKKATLFSYSRIYCLSAQIGKQLIMFSTGKKTTIFKKNMEMPGIEPGAFHMQSERSTTEPHPPVVIRA